MPEIVRVREARYRGDDGEYSSDDDRTFERSRGYKTVQRYRVGPGRVEEVEDDRRVVRSERVDAGGRNERLEVDRRVERVDRIERPRSAHERYREPEHSHESSRTVIYERDRERQRDRSPESARPWERERDRTWEREVERRHHDDESVEVERYQRETEYYSRPEPQPIVIRQRAPEPQKIYVETAPPPPIIIPQERQGYEVVRRQDIVESREVAPRNEEDYYYRREVRDVNPRREEAYYDRREHHRRPSEGDYNEDELIIRKEKKVIKGRSKSPYHKLHLAEGALAGAGAAALIANHRDKTGGTEHRGRTIAGGAALGAIGAEVITRARSHYRDKENRSRSSSRGNHTKLKTGLAIAATALAAAAAGKYISNRNNEKEEMQRGRSRTRSISRRRASTGDHGSDDRGRSKSKSRVGTIAKAGVAAAAVTAAAKRLRSKSRGRSKSKIRSGAEIAAAGLAGAAAAGIYQNRKAKKDAADEEATEKQKRSRTRSRRRSRSAAYSDIDNDDEFGMVEYGADPVYSRRSSRGNYGPPAEINAAAYSRSRSRNRDASASRSRSRSRMTSGGLAGTAGAYNRPQKGRRHDQDAADFYANDPYDDFPPSPPRASGGAFPYSAQAGYNAAEYDGRPAPPPVGSYPARREGENVSATRSYYSQSYIPFDVPPQPRHIRDVLHEEGSLSPPSPSTPRTPSPPPKKSVNFGPLPPGFSGHNAHARKRRRGISDPSLGLHYKPSQPRRRRYNPTRSPSPIKDDIVEKLPARFDKDGRLLDNGLYKGSEDDIAWGFRHNFDDVLEGRPTWKSLRTFWDEARRR